MKSASETNPFMSLFTNILASFSSAMSWQMDAQSISGPVREHNEDYVLTACNGGTSIAILADGVGGHNAGEVAAKFVCDELVAWFHNREPLSGLEKDRLALGEAIREIHGRLFRLSQKESEQSGMATTLAMVLQHGRHAIYAWAGDSRIYLLHDGKLRQLSHDHSFVQEKFRQGIFSKEDADQHPMGNIITSCLGARETIEQLGLECVNLKKGDELLLVSDGVSDVVSEEQLAALIPQGVEAILLAAQEAFSSDNCSAVIVEVS